MGRLSDFLIALGFMKKKVNILCVGLDNSGKTTIINSLNPNKVNNDMIVPTIGFSIETFTKSKLNLTVIDMSGQGRYRDLWEHYYADVDAVIFVVDSSDKIRTCVAKDELEQMLNHKDLKKRKIPILFFANKNDIEDGMSVADCSNALGLNNVKTKNWYICSCNGLTGDGITTGFNWLMEQL